MNVSMAEFREIIKKQTRSKYRAVRVDEDGIRFDSKAEAAHYRQLRGLWKLGEVLWFVRQTPFDLPGGAKYRADFLVVMKDGTVRIDDVKGFFTPMSRLKIKQVESIYGVKINIIRACKRTRKGI